VPTRTVAAAAVAALGGILTRLDDWYYALEKPAWKPPDWLFGPAWTTIFVLAALAAADGWRSSAAAGRRRLLVLFALNAVLNVAWSALFFQLRRPDWALLEVGFLWLSIVLLIVALSRTSARAAWLLAPYLAWVSFAAAVNFAIVRQNAPFGA